MSGGLMQSSFAPVSTPLEVTRKRQKLGASTVKRKSRRRTRKNGGLNEMFSDSDYDSDDSESGEEHFSEYYDGHHHRGHHHGGYHRRDYNYMNELFTARFILVIFAIFILFSVLLAVSSSKN